MMASVSIAARESLRVSNVSLLNSHDRSVAVRNVHLPLTRTRLTPRAAYSSCRRSSAPCTSTPCGIRAASDFSSSGSAEANSIASSNRSSSGRISACASGAVSGSSTSTGITTVSLGIALASSIPWRRRRRHAVCRRQPILPRYALAHVDRRERPLLVNLHQSLAHELERRGEARREHRRRERRLDHERDQIFVEPRPIRGLADQALERLARLGGRPDGALGQPT